MIGKIRNKALVLLCLLVVSACDREPVPPPEPEIYRTSVAGLRQMFENGITTVDTNLYIQGIITLTPELGNLPAFIAYLQDSTAGICLTVSGENTFALNSEVKILCRGASFTQFNGLLQFGDISIADQTELVRLTASPPSPVKTTLAELLTGKHQAEYVLIENVQFRDPGNFSGTKILTDCMSEVEVYTRSDATFSSEKLPTGNGSFRGIASVYTDVQLLLRDKSDVDMTADRCGLAGVIYLEEDFATLTRNADVSTLSGWKSYSEAGGKSWYGNEVTGKGKWVQATAYNSNQPVVTTWMIAPALDLTLAVKPFISFESANGYDNGATLGLFVSTGYAGSSTPWTSSWTKLNFNLPAGSPSGYSSFVSSGMVDLSPYKGQKVYVAWVYQGADLSGSSSDKTTTWEIDNVLVGEK